MLFAHGFDDAIIGWGYRCGEEQIAVYDRDRCLRVLMGRGMTEEEAAEYFAFNVQGAWVGPATPMFVQLCSLAEIQEMYMEEQ